MRIGVLTEETTNEDVAVALKEAGEKLGAEVVVIDPKECVVVNFKDPQVLFQGKPLEKLDACLVRGSENMLDFKLYLVEYLAKLGTIMVNNSQSIRLCNNKFETQTMLNSIGLKAPDTIAIVQIEQLDAAVHYLKEKFPMIVKTVSGSHGVGVIKVDTYESLKSIVQLLLATDTNLMLQEFIPHKESGRIMTLGDRVIASVMRSIPDGDFRSNMDQGAELTKYQATPEEGEVALKVAKALGCVLSAIDYIVNEDKEMVIFEANSSPGLKGIQGVNEDIDIAKEIMQYVISLVGAPSGVPAASTEPAAPTDAKGSSEEEEEEEKHHKKKKINQLGYVAIPVGRGSCQGNDKDKDDESNSDESSESPDDEEEEETIDKNGVGLVEEIIIKRINNDAPFSAKVDTGADRCSLHGESIDIGEGFVRFGIGDVTYKVPMERTVNILSANGDGRRAVVKFNIEFKGQSYEGVEFTIADRSDLKYDVIIGKNLLQLANVVINPQE
jgi:RimK family alpha-L-glutamate ligase